MNLEEFVQRRTANWTRLTAILTHIKNGTMSQLPPEEVEQLGPLYRQVTSDLAIARRDFPKDRVTTYLNQLAGRAHSFIYQGEVFEPRDIIRFYRYGFPALYRETLPFTAVAFGLFFVSGLIFYILTLITPSTAEHILPPGIIGTVQRHQIWTTIASSDRSLASSAIITNNIRVSFIAFAGGILLGIGTVYAMVSNGIILGAAAGYVQLYGLSTELWSFVAGHGFIELSVIFMAGGGGFMLAYAILHPGLYTRGDALRLAANKAVRLMFGCVPLLVIAGAIEGFISPSSLPALVKFAIGITTGILLYSYLFFSRPPAHKRDRPRLSLTGKL